MISIRTMEERDTEAVAELEAQIFSKPWSRKGFLDALHMEGTVFLVAEEDSKIAGYIGMYTAPPEGEITNVAVAPQMRCRGIGKSLIDGIKSEAKKHAVSSIILEVRVSNENAIRLYEKNGFTKQGVRKGFYELPKEDAYIMLYGQ